MSAATESTLVEEMRSWIADCEWDDLSPSDAASLSATEVLTGINRWYAGGVAQFVRDGGVS